MDKILVVDDEQGLREMMSIFLQKEGYAVSTASHGAEAVGMIRRECFDLVITDLRMPEMDGLQLLKEIKKILPSCIVLMMTAYASTETAVQSMKEGAYDYIPKPFRLEEVRHVIQNALEKKKLRDENLRLKQALKEQNGFGSFIAGGAKIRKVLDLARKIARHDSNILISGESGTGKEVLARAIHYGSRRKNHPLVPVHCGALPETLLESELFGYVKGAFTGAVTHKEGLFETAHQGTLFLDEIGDTSLAVQAKLLRVLQEREFRRVGGTRDIQIDVRIIAATNRDLEQSVAEGSFREDLFYRLNVIPIHLPPLRARAEDIAVLAEFFLQKYAQTMHKPIKGIGPDAIRLLMEQRWRGNVRELENVMERTVALSTTEMITAGHLRECLQKPSAAHQLVPWDLPDEGMNLERLMDALEKYFLLRALERSSGVKKRAAELLGLNFRSFRYRLTKHASVPQNGHSAP